jgi:hypothetical protein
MAILIDHYEGNEEYRTLAISHYTRKLKEKKKKKKERKGQALSFKFLAQDMVRILGNIYYDLLQS